MGRPLGQLTKCPLGVAFDSQYSYNKNITNTSHHMTATYQANLLTPDTEYNGWTNYETWNAALWIGSEEGLYDIARRAMDWEHLLEIFANWGTETTGDGVRWDDPKINAVEMDEMLEEL